MTLLHIAVFAVVSGLAVWGFFIEPFRVRRNYQKIALPAIPAELSPLKVVHLSDLHIRKYDRRHRLAVRYIHRLDPDLICITGDFGTENSSAFTEFLYKLRYKAPVYACIGNNDYDLETLKECFRRTNCYLLLDEVRAFEKNGTTVSIVGITPKRKTEDVLELLSGASRPRILLSHYPSIFDHIQDEAELVLSGHTHGGQCRLPIAGPVMLYGLARTYASGLFEREGSALFVSRGLGTYVINVRFLCPPEVAVLELTHQSS